jgi:S-adenosylmethionine:tRNA ribosyltransferase-isomerase
VECCWCAAENPILGLLTRDYKGGGNADFADGLNALVPEKRKQRSRFEFNQQDSLPFCNAHGLMPLPQYIEKARKHDGMTPSIETDKDRYQTVYAKYDGSIAAPTAGFHFTPELLPKLKDKGVKICYITLHVGWGTFKPLRGEPEQHHMLAELGEVSEETAAALNAVRAAGKRVFSCGTTSTRTLESFTDENHITHSGRKWTDLFIYPGYRFKAIDCLIPNSLPGF